MSIDKVFHLLIWQQWRFKMAESLHLIQFISKTSLVTPDFFFAKLLAMKYSYKTVQLIVHRLTIGNVDYENVWMFNLACILLFVCLSGRQVLLLISCFTANTMSMVPCSFWNRHWYSGRSPLSRCAVSLFSRILASMFCLRWRGRISSGGYGRRGGSLSACTGVW